MADPALAEQRSGPRLLLKLLPGPLVDQAQKVLQCKPIDLSPSGLSILTSSLLPLGSELVLKTHKDTVRFVVVWQKPDFGKQGLFRYGLEVVDRGVDLEALFRAASCLK